VLSEGQEALADLFQVSLEIHTLHLLRGLFTLRALAVVRYILGDAAQFVGMITQSVDRMEVVIEMNRQGFRPRCQLM